MVAATETVIDEGAVVIKILDTPVTDLAVETRLGLNHLIIDTEVVQVETSFEKVVH